MTVEELIPTIAAARNEALKRIASATERIFETREAGDAKAHNKAFDELLLWTGIKEDLISALNGLIKAGHMRDKNFGKRFEKVGVVE